MYTHIFNSDEIVIIHNPVGTHTYTVSARVSVVLYIFFCDITDLVEATLITHCAVSGASITVYIMHIQKDKQKLSLTTVQQHDCPHTHSNILVKGVLYDESIMLYKGTIVVTQQAENTHAEQKSHTLLLSSKAYAQATPSLEVLTKKVHCKHGSAIAACNSSMIEYLKSRGLPFILAQDLLVESFFLSILHHQKAYNVYISLAQNNPLI